MMQLTDILFQYLSEVQCEELKADVAYQEARAARNAAEKALVETLPPKQRRLFHSYMEQVNYVDSLELRHFFSRCSLLLLPQVK